MDESGDGAALPAVEVEIARESERGLIEALFQFYAYDFSEMEPAGSTTLEVDAAGRFEPYRYMDEYWRTGNRWPLLIRAGGHAAGFALINTLSHRGAEVDRNMAEFFVMRKHRRRGVA